MAISVQTLRTTDTRRCLSRFLAVGVLGTCLDIALFTGLHVLLGVPTLAANTCSYTAGMLNNFILHRRWTFASRSHKTLGAEFLQFALVNLLALTLNNVLILLLTQPFTALLTHPAPGDVLAKLFATGVSMSWNFFANTFWTFRNPVSR